MGRSYSVGRFPPVPVGRFSYEVAETSHPTRRLEADMARCDPKRSSVPIASYFLWLSISSILTQAVTGRCLG